MGNTSNYSPPCPWQIPRLPRTRRSLFALLSLLFLLLLVYHCASMFCIHLSFPAKIPQNPTSFSPENVAGDSIKSVYSSSFRKLSSSAMSELNEENPPLISKTHLSLLRKSHSLMPNTKISSAETPPEGNPKSSPAFKFLQPEAQNKEFSRRVKQFFHSSNHSCKFRFFMTWISPLESFTNRDFFTIESLFKSHPNGCLIIISNSMDSSQGTQILKPFIEKGFRVTSISPDVSYLFKNTVAQSWFDRLISGKIDPGEVPLGQNLSNLLRLGLLYKFGGIYIDTDMIILKSFSNLRNSIAAQTIDRESKNWTRLNNAVMIFDKGHPLLYKFIQEFALTFDGNKWGHNGPYLVSRVVSRVQGRPGFRFNVLSPMAFYPVDWSRIGRLFRGRRSDSENLKSDSDDSKWLIGKLKQIRSESFGVHLWNKESRKLEVEEGSIIQSLFWDCCLFCNSSVSI